MNSFRTKCDLSCIIVNFPDFALHEIAATGTSGNGMTIKNALLVDDSKVARCALA